MSHLKIRGRLIGAFSLLIVLLAQIRSAMMPLHVLRNRFIGHPVARLATIMGELARGAHGVTIPDVNHHDEIGDMLRHFRTQRADITGDVSGLAA